MGRKIFGIVTILLIFGLVAGWYYFTQGSKYFNTSAFKAVPFKSAVIVRVHNLDNFTGKSLKGAFLKEYSQLPGIEALSQNIHFADSLFRNDPNFSKYFSGKALTIAAGGETGRQWNLYIMELSDMAEKTTLTALINDYFRSRNASSVNRKAGEANIKVYYHSFGPSTSTFSVTFYKGLMIAGTDPETVTEAAVQLDGQTLAEDTEFQKVTRTASPDADLNIYLNHQALVSYLSPLFSTRIKQINQSRIWSEFDFTQKENEILFNGFTFVPDSLNDYAGVLLRQKPSVSGLAKFMPDETSFYLCLNLENTERYFRDYEEMMKKSSGVQVSGSGVRDSGFLSETDTLFSFNPKKFVIENMKGEAGIVFTTFDPINPSMNRFFMMKTINGAKADSLMFNLVKHPRKGDPSWSPQITQEFSLGKETHGQTHDQTHDRASLLRISRLPFTDFPQKAFGRIFEGVPAVYYTVLGDILLMGGSFESVSEYARSILLNETLSSNQVYKDFTEGFSQPLSIGLWISPSNALPFFRNELNVNLYSKLENQQQSLRKIESVGWQAGYENGMLYNVGKITSSSEPHTRPATSWRTRLDSLVSGRPQLVMSPFDKESREVVVQDVVNNIYLIGKEGEVIMKKKLPGPLLSNVFTVNYYRDKRLQYLFNTAEAIHMIDREGNYIKGYPARLPARATNGIGVFDYDGSFDYRIFVGCADKNIYALDRNGTIIPGWKTTPVLSEVNVPVQFFRIEGRDYITFFDKSKTYIMDRKGKPRVIMKEEFSPSPNNGFTLEPASGKNPARLVTTASYGTVCMVSFDGSLKKIQTGKFSDKHYFIDEDLNNDGAREYIYLDGEVLSVYTSDGKLLFIKKFKNNIDIAPAVFVLEKGKKIGVADRKENLIHLFNADGSEYNGFPAEGNSAFDLGYLNPISRRFNVIVGTGDGYLNNYTFR